MAIERVQTVYNSFLSVCTNDDTCSEDEAQEIDEGDLCSINLSKKMVHKYNNLQEVRSRFEARKPDCLTDATYACILRQNKFVKVFCSG